jgi:uncharacterized protein YndB with AHSA1/START domain
MAPLTVAVSTHVDRPIQEVWDYLDVLANHETFTDHMLTDWSLSGPPAGVGAKAHVKANSPGPTDWLDIEVQEVDPPHRSVEQTIGAKGKRKSFGTYTLTESGGGTDVQFEIRIVEMPGIERVFAPLTKAWLRRGNQKAMDRLKALLEGA